MRPNLLGFSLAALCAIALQRSLLAANTYQVVVRDGQSAGTGNGNFSSDTDPVLNDLGRVAFEGSTSTASYFLGVEGPEAAHIVARDGLQAPDMPAGVTFGQLAFKFSLRQSSDNEIAFTGDITGPGITSSNDSGIWAGDPGNLKLIAQTNDVAPGAGGQQFSTLDDGIGFGNGGFVGFVATLQNNKSGIWAGTDNNVQLVAMEGGTPPGFAGYQFGHFFRYKDHATNNNQQRVAFEETITSPSKSLGGIWAGSPGNLQLVANEGLAIPSLGSGSQILFLHQQPQINDDNDVAFSATVGAPTDISLSNAILLKTASGISPIYDPKSVPPGFSAGTTYGTQWDFYLGSSRRIVFHNSVQLADSTSKNALFAYDNGNLRLVAREDQLLPSAPDNAHFADFIQYYINQQGRVAFMAETDNGSGLKGIWSEDANHQLFEVVREGEQVQLAPGDVRKVLDIEWPDTVSGGFSPLLPFNSAGQVVFQAYLSAGGTAILLYTPAASAPGDYNHNGVVDAADYVVWRDSQNATGTGLAADGNADGHVDAADYQIWRSHFGQTSAAGSGTFTLLAVPEPASFSILLLVASLLCPSASLRRSQRS